MIFVVNGNIWRLDFVRSSSNNLQRSDGTFTFGVTDNNLKTVFMADNLSNYMRDKVFLHELTHVHAFEYDYVIPIEVEEIVADFLSLYGRDIVSYFPELARMATAFIDKLEEKMNTQ